MLVNQSDRRRLIGFVGGVREFIGPFWSTKACALRESSEVALMPLPISAPANDRANLFSILIGAGKVPV